MARLGSYLQSIDQIRGVEWSKSWLWDIRFGPGADPRINPAPPSPFDTWFPAFDYNETSRVSNTLAMPYYLSQYKILQTSSNIDIQLSFHDDVKGSLYNWVVDWFSYVLDDSDGVCMLEDAYRQMDVLKLNSQREPIKRYTYYVIPEADIRESLHSQTDTKTYSVSFAVIGRLPPDNYIL